MQGAGDEFPSTRSSLPDRGMQGLAKQGAGTPCQQECPAGMGLGLAAGNRGRETQPAGLPSCSHPSHPHDRHSHTPPAHTSCPSTPSARGTSALGHSCTSYPLLPPFCPLHRRRQGASHAANSAGQAPVHAFPPALHRVHWNGSCCVGLRMCRGGRRRLGGWLRCLLPFGQQSPFEGGSQEEGGGCRGVRNVGLLGCDQQDIEVHVRLKLRT